MTNYLEELVVPQPPYRMARPIARLAADIGEPFNGIRIEAPESKTQENQEPLGEKEQRDRFVAHITQAKLPETASPEQRAELAALKEELSHRASSLTPEEVVAVEPPKPKEVPPAPSINRGEKSYKVGDTYRQGKTEAKVLEMDARGRPTALRTEEKVEPTPIEAPATKEPTTEERLQNIRDTQEELRAQGKEDEAKTWDEAAAKYEAYIKEHSAKPEPVEPVELEKPAGVGSETVYIRPAGKPKKQKDELPPNMNLVMDRYEASGEQMSTGHGAGLKEKKEQQSDFQIATSFDELEAKLRSTPVVKGSKESFAGEEQASRVADARKSFEIAQGKMDAPIMRAALNEITRADGLRDKVVELLQKEKESWPVEPEVTPEAKPESRSEVVQPQETKAQDALVEIERMANLGAPDFWERQAAGVEAAMHGAVSWWWGIWSKQAQDAMASRETRIKALQLEEKRSVEKSLAGTILGSVVYGSRIAWHRWHRDSAEALREQFDMRKARYENARTEVLRLTANQLEKALTANEQRVKKLIDLRGAFETMNAALDAELLRVRTDIATTADAVLKEQLRTRRASLEADISEAAKLQWRYNRIVTQENEKAARVSGTRNTILQSIIKKA